MAELLTPQGHSHHLPEGCVTVGSDAENDIPIASQFALAPQHFTLQPWQGGHFLEDAGSGLGTLVNGHPVSWKPLLNGDLITAGELQLVYQSQSLPPPPKTAPAPAPARSTPRAPLFETPPTPPPLWLPADLLSETPLEPCPRPQ